MKKIFFICLIVIFLTNCCKLPYFGTLILSEKYVDNFYSLPNEYSVKHITHISFEHDENSEIDIIGYLMVKNGNFRLLGMNEVGITLFDLFQEKGKPLNVIKSFPELEKYDVLQNIVSDIRLAFLSGDILRAKNIEMYAEENKINYVLTEKNNWTLWEIRNGKNLITHISQGAYQSVFREITYDKILDKNFPVAIYIKYPEKAVEVEIEILNLEARKIDDAKFFPGKKNE